MKAEGGKRKKKAPPSFAQPADSKIFRERSTADLAATAIFYAERRAEALQHKIYCLLLGENEGKKHLQTARVGVEWWKLKEVAKIFKNMWEGKEGQTVHEWEWDTVPLPEQYEDKNITELRLQSLVQL